MCVHVRVRGHGTRVVDGREALRSASHISSVGRVPSVRPLRAAEDVPTTDTVHVWVRVWGASHLVVKPCHRCTMYPLTPLVGAKPWVLLHAMSTPCFCIWLGFPPPLWRLVYDAYAVLGVWCMMCVARGGCAQCDVGSVMCVSTVLCLTCDL
jgi:hypothetical protein